MICPVCLNAATTRHPFPGKDIFLETTRKVFHYRHCTGCRSLFIDPLPQPSELGEFYPQGYWWRRESGHLKKLESIYRRIALRDHVAFIDGVSRNFRQQGRAPRLLDVGCGGGTLLSVLQDRGFNVVGFDSSAEAAAIASRQNRVPVISGASLDEGKFGDASFDIISLFHVMEHVCDPRRLLADVRRLLHAGGRLVVQVPNVESWQSRMCGMRWYGLDAPRHVINYSEKAIGRVLSDSGFRVRRIRHFNLRDNAPALASSLFPSLDPIARNVRQRMRNTRERVSVAWFKHAAYFGVMAALYPFAIAEAVNGCGATLMIDAEKL